MVCKGLNVRLPCESIPFLDHHSESVVAVWTKQLLSWQSVVALYVLVLLINTVGPRRQHCKHSIKWAFGLTALLSYLFPYARYLRPICKVCREAKVFTEGLLKWVKRERDDSSCRLERKPHHPSGKRSSSLESLLQRYQGDKRYTLLQNTFCHGFCFVEHVRNFQVKGKVNSITLDSCKKTSIVFDSLLSQVEVINCQKVQIQVLIFIPSFQEL